MPLKPDVKNFPSKGAKEESPNGRHSQSSSDLQCEPLEDLIEAAVKEEKEAMGVPAMSLLNSTMTESHARTAAGSLLNLQLKDICLTASSQ